MHSVGKTCLQVTATTQILRLFGLLTDLLYMGLALKQYYRKWLSSTDNKIITNTNKRVAEMYIASMIVN